MLLRSEAIILKRTPYSDNSAIIKALTKSSGILTFIIRGIHGKTGKSAMYQPGSILELVFYNQNNRSLKNIKECQLLKDYSGLPTDPLRMQVLIFCTELVGKCLAEEETDEHLFESIRNFFIQINNTDALQWMPLNFTLNLIQLLGFGFTEDQSDSGSKHNRHYQQIFLENEELASCTELLKTGTAQCNREKRNIILEKLLNHLRIQLSLTTEFKSYRVLQEMFS